MSTSSTLEAKSRHALLDILLEKKLLISMCAVQSGIENIFRRLCCKFNPNILFSPPVQRHAFEMEGKVGNGSRRPTLHFASFSTQ